MLRSFLLVLALTASAIAQTGFHQRTDWEVRPSLTFDALCLLNVLSGDPYYRDYYNESYDRLAPSFTPAEKTAFRNLKTRIKDQNGGIISANLALYFSAAKAETLDDLIAITRDPHKLQQQLKKTDYYSDDGWKTFDAARPDLEAALLALKRIHFDQYWEQNVRPVVAERGITIRKELQQANIVPLIEKRIGRPLPSDRITVYLLYYSEPHGIKIVGTNFITHYSYPVRIVLRNAIHEMMHPPFDPKDARVQAAIQALGKDPYLVDKIEHHDRSFGYNTLSGMFEEDCVQALEQNVAEGLSGSLSENPDLVGNPRKYWAEQDGGMHVLAVALYELMREEKFSDSSETFTSFLARMIESGRLAPGKIEAVNQAFFAAK